ncbi:hypothetical protein F8E02_02365 [Methanoculleus sp. Wushi-C6]|uniref:Uncharacterized protein n=1 Tax=Methanoculleus caldifontis TaxID=2651577 RepID=A0ABU3WYJ1_9EURY|nr:hypothetical protein [Methanoculleus sp. Wushi-C6]MDV2480867.1 hypothetical protein [Methanoculleus sp. Wushi-C6]
MIEISQQYVAAALTFAIQALVVGGLVACIVIGPQNGSSLEASPSAGIRNVDDRPDTLPPAGHPADGLPEVRVQVSVQPDPSGGHTLSFSA